MQQFNYKLPLAIFVKMMYTIRVLKMFAGVMEW